MESSAAGGAPIRIVLADDHAVVRRGLQLLLEAEDGFEVVASAGDVESAIRTTVRRAAAGQTYLNPQLGARMAAEPPAPPGPPDDLSEREVEVLRMIALGHTNAEIAERLYLSIRTVESHPRPHPAEAAPLVTRRPCALRARPRPR